MIYYVYTKKNIMGRNMCLHTFFSNTFILMNIKIQFKYNNPFFKRFF